MNRSLRARLGRRIRRLFTEPVAGIERPRSGPERARDEWLLRAPHRH